MAKLLDENGLAYFWGKVKAAISAKMDSTNPVGTGSFAMNMASGATLGTNAHVEGTECEATTEANHAEGYRTSATGSYAHAEGRSTLAGGYASHAEGDSTAVNGKAAHVEGRSTVASGEYQHVQGKYNVEDTADTYAHIVGNGTADETRSNAHTLDWSGNAWFAGKVTVGAAPTEDLDVATKKYTDDAIAGKTSESEIFWAEYDGVSGTGTAFSEIMTAYNAGKMILCKRHDVDEDGLIYMLSGFTVDYDDSIIDFVFSSSDRYGVYELTCNKDNKYWSTGGFYRPTIVTGKLTSGGTSLTLIGSSINTSSMIDIYTDDYTIAPTNAEVTDGSITLTFDAQTKNVNVKVKVTN